MNGVMSWVMCDGWRVSRCETKDNVNLIVLFLRPPTTPLPRPLRSTRVSCDVLSSHDVDDGPRNKRAVRSLWAYFWSVQGSAVVSRGLGNITNRLPGERCQDPLARGIFDAPRVGPAARRPSRPAP